MIDDYVALNRALDIPRFVTHPRTGKRALARIRLPYPLAVIIVA
jgi:hypothetical protein